MIFDVRDYGAVGDGKTFDTQAIQRCVDACAAAGGGRVLLENGVFLTGTLILKSYIDFHISANATLLGSPNCEDYPPLLGLKHIDAEKCPRKRASCLLFAEEAEGLSVSGLGQIDGNGQHFVKLRTDGNSWKRYERINAETPPRVVFLCGCRHCRLENISIVNQPSGWAYWIHDCDDIAMNALTVKASLEYPNNDGIHINSSRDITVTNCNITASDDALIVRANNVTLPENKVCERVAVTNCNLISHCGGIRIGWINDGTVRNCTFSDLTITDSRNGVLITMPWRGPDRIPDEGREESVIENITFDNLVMDRIHDHPVRIKIDDREGTRVRCKRVSRLFFRGIKCRGLQFPSLEGSRRCKLEDIYFNDCIFEKEDRSAEYGELVFDPAQFTCKEIHGECFMAKVHNLYLENTRFIDSSTAE